MTVLHENVGIRKRMFLLPWFLDPLKETFLPKPFWVTEETRSNPTTPTDSTKMTRKIEIYAQPL